MGTTAVEYQIQVQSLTTQNLHSPDIAALFDVLISDALLLRSCTLRRGKRGLYVLYPARKLSDGQYLAYCEPKTAALRLAVEGAAVQAYEASVDADAAAASEAEVQS